MQSKTKIKHISLLELNELALNLARQVESSGFVPQHILYIERVGLFFAYDISKYFSCSISGIKASRSGGSVKSKLSFILRYMPNFATDILRRIEERSGIHSSINNRQVEISSILPPKGKKILIIDDAIDTGNSMRAVIAYLVSEGYNRSFLKSAVITNTKETPSFTSDFALFNFVSCAFPWSYASKEFKKAWKLYANLISSIANDS